jgi:hypothetical protein
MCPTPPFGDVSTSRIGDGTRLCRPPAWWGLTLPRLPTLTAPGDCAGVTAPAPSDNLGLDDVLRVVLLEVEQVACYGGPRRKNAQVRIHPKRELHMDMEKDSENRPRCSRYFLSWAGLRRRTRALTQQPESSGIVQCQDQFWLDWRRIGVVERPQLFFNCTLCPTRTKGSVYSGSHKKVSQVYFSKFEPIDLTQDSIMQRAGVPMLYDMNY